MPYYTILVPLVLSIAFPVFSSFRSKRWIELYQPVNFISLILLYYTLLGPLLLFLGPTSLVYRGVDHTPYLFSGWLATLVFQLCLLFGFSLPKTRSAVPRYQPSIRTYRLGYYLCSIGLILFFLASGSRLLDYFNPLSSSTFSSFLPPLISGSFANYFLYSVNLLIPGTTLIFSSFKLARRSFICPLTWLLVSTVIYTSLGFRYRLLILFASVFVTYFLARSRRPPLLFTSVLLSVMILVSGFLGLTRNYGSGLNLERLDNRPPIVFLLAGLHESSVFLTTSAVIHNTQLTNRFVGLLPLRATLEFPVPRQIMPSKADASYLTSRFESLYGDLRFSHGSAILNIGEYFLVAGYPSLIIFSVLLGLILKLLWLWFLPRHRDPMAQTLYILSCTFLYVVMSRGYMPQVALLFCFSVLPLFFLYKPSHKSHS